MITIDQLNVTVTVEGGGEPGDVAFARLFNRYIDHWWREVQARIRQDSRAEADRSVVPAARERS